MPPTQQERQEMAEKLFTAHHGPSYAADLAVIFTRRLSRAKRQPGQRTRIVTPNMIAQWKARQEIPRYAARIAAQLIQA